MESRAARLGATGRAGEPLQERGALDRILLAEHVLDRPGQTPRPVLVRYHRRHVDPLEPAEDVLHGKQDELRGRTECAPEHGISYPIREGFVDGDRRIDEGGQLDSAGAFVAI